MLNLFSKGDYVVDIYLSILTPDSMYIRGRVVREKDHMPSGRNGHFKALINSLMRFNSSELKYARLKLTSGDNIVETIADEEGFFTFREQIKNWKNSNNFTVDLLDAPNPARSYGYFKNTETEDSIGVVTDIDDTILHTGVSSFLKLKLIYNSLFINPFKRDSIDGAAEFLKKIDTDGPYFYVSNSPWNIFNYLQSFLDFNDFPDGSMILRDIDIATDKKDENQYGNKFVEIKRIFQMHPNYQFFLIGDAAEIDIDIYLAIDKEFNDRVKKIYIRLTGKSSKDERILKLAADHDHVRTFLKFEDLITEIIS